MSKQKKGCFSQLFFFKMDEERLLALEAKLERIERHCSNMTEHIGFVESVYRAIQAPFQRMLGFFSFRHQALPEPTHNLIMA